MYEEINLELTDFTSVISTENVATAVQEVETTDITQSSSLSSSDTQQITWLSHNSLLNCLFILTNKNKLILYDCNSKAILKQVDLNSTEFNKGLIRVFLIIYDNFLT